MEVCVGCRVVRYFQGNAARARRWNYFSTCEHKVRLSKSADRTPGGFRPEPAGALRFLTDKLRTRVYSPPPGAPRDTFWTDSTVIFLLTYYVVLTYLLRTLFIYNCILYTPSTPLPSFLPFLLLHGLKISPPRSAPPPRGTAPRPTRPVAANRQLVATVGEMGRRPRRQSLR